MASADPIAHARVHCRTEDMNRYKMNFFHYPDILARHRNRVSGCRIQLVRPTRAGKDPGSQSTRGARPGSREDLGTRPLSAQADEDVAGPAPRPHLLGEISSRVRRQDRR